MKIALICFTENGFQMEKRLVKLLEAEGHGPCPWVSGRYAMQAARRRSFLFFMVSIFFIIVLVFLSVSSVCAGLTL